MQGHEPTSPDEPQIVRAPGRSVTSGDKPVSVTGVMERIGGRAELPPRGVAGIIYFESEDGTVTTTMAAADGRFTIAVPAGRYTVSGAPTGWGGGARPACFADDAVEVPADGLDGVEVVCRVR